jgi:hypothetical protein
MAALGLGLVGYELWPSDERRITALLNDLCAKLNQTRDAASLVEIRTALRAALLPNASLRVTELSLDAQDADDVIARASELLTSGVPLSFALNSIEVHLSGHLARVDVDLIASTRGSGEQSRDLRHTHVRLAKSAVRWQIEAVEVDSVARSEPEARP